MDNAPKIVPGDEVEDTITGFKGIVIAVTKWLHGCWRATVQPQGLHEGKPIDAHTFDEPQLKVLNRKAQPSTAVTGGDAPSVTRPSTPPRH